MNQLRQDIQAELSRGILVFPSEVAASFWRRHAALRLGAVREDRLISWDTFKESAFDLRDERIPCNRTIRRAFAESLINRNADLPFLNELIPAEYAADATGFLPLIESILPRIRAALTILKGDLPVRLLRVASDLERLHAEYSLFMDTHGFFEPRWLQLGRHFRGGNFVLVAPHLADDYPEFAADLPLEIITPAANTNPVLQIYPDSRAEITSVLHSLSSLLDDGEDPETIAVTVCDYDRIAGRLIDGAVRYGVPLRVRSGAPLLSSGAGRLLQGIREVVASGFSVHAAEGLLLNRSIPWKSPQVNAELVIQGVRIGALGGAKKADRRWRRLDKTRRHTEVADLFRILSRQAPRIVDATSFSELSIAFNQFLSMTVDAGAWLPDDERILQRCQEELNQLKDLQADTGLRIHDPFLFWINRLSEKQYVPQQQGSGVPILPYRVSALIGPDHHFVINANHAATSIISTALPFLADADREVLGETMGDRDLTVDLLNAYTDSGRVVEFSAARQTYDGSAIPAGFFIAPDRSTEIPDTAVLTGEESDSYAWEESGRTPHHPEILQAVGVQQFLRGARTAGPDFTRTPIADKVVTGVIARRLAARTNQEAVRLSASSIDVFRACAFQFLLSFGLGLEELTLTVDPDDPGELGRLYHDVLGAFFAELARDGQTFVAADVSTHVDHLSRIADRFFSMGRGMIPDIVYRARRPSFDEIARNLLDNDAIIISDHEVLHTEAWKAEQEIEKGYVLVGRLDRVTRGPDGRLTLIDYKKSGLPTKKSLQAGSAEAVGLSAMDLRERDAQMQMLGPVQIPLYVRLLESAGERVSQAGYYGLESSKYLPVFDETGSAVGRPAVTRERFQEIITLVDEIVSRAVARIVAGDFRCADGCDGCAMRTVCRSRYHVG